MAIPLAAGNQPARIGIQEWRDADSDVLLTTARRYRIDAEKVQKCVAQEFAAKQKKKDKKAMPDESAA